MLVMDAKGNELVEVISIDEKNADEKFSPVTHALAVIKVGSEYLMGWNKWRSDWEIFGGVKEADETLRECIIRECYEELGLENADFTFLGLMHFKLAPGFFNNEWHEEYGGLYGVTLPDESIETLSKSIIDKDEIEKLTVYSRINKEEKIAKIDEKLLEYWK